jgi:hypothetical protein
MMTLLLWMIFALIVAFGARHLASDPVIRVVVPAIVLAPWRALRHLVARPAKKPKSEDGAQLAHKASQNPVVGINCPRCGHRGGVCGNCGADLVKTGSG